MEKAAQQASAVPSQQPRIVIADDFEMLRRGLKSLLGTAICGEAENGQQAVERVMELRPDIVILVQLVSRSYGNQKRSAHRKSL
jgi:NarL family two-component system response regulator LiaR